MTDAQLSCETSDVLVFPSCADTFGNVITGSMAFGRPVGAYPVTGPGT